MSVQEKKQATISRFFSAKTPSAPVKDKPVPQSEPSPKNDGDSLFVDDDGGDVPVASGPRAISKQLGRFKEREADDGGPPPKRRKTASPPDEDHTSERNALTELSSPSINVNIATSQRQNRGSATGSVSRYTFANQSSAKENDVSEDEETAIRKQKQHDRFVKKLGYPDSINDIKRRSGWIDDETTGADEGAEDEDAEDDPPPPKVTKNKGTSAKKGSGKLTPMEKQFLEIKKKHKDTIIIYEVGYKFRFFGEDARVAAKELNIVCIPGKFRFDEHPSEAHIDRFASASIPVHRLQVHTKRLIEAGHKVGIVRQIETAALKAVGDNRNAPFVRKLTNLYTKGTYVDDVDGLDSDSAAPAAGAPATGHLLCITETNAKGWGNDEKVDVGLVAVQPGTGEVIYDNFEDGFMRSELETRLLHIAPCEFLIVGDLSKATERLVQHLSGSKLNVFGEKARVERVDRPKTAAAEAYTHIDSFYSGTLRSSEDADGGNRARLLDKVHKLAENVSICLSAMIRHLTEYGLEHVFDLTKNFQPFSSRSYMLLNGNTLNSLEIFRNQTDKDEKGSLLWVLDQTQTRFGQRLLRKWVGRPLLNKTQLQERIDAVEELNDKTGSATTEKLRGVLSKTKLDLERSLIRVYYGKCTRPELLQMLQTLQRVASEYAHVESPTQTGFQAELLKQAVASLPRILQDVVSYLDRINTSAAKHDDKTEFFLQEHETDDISEHKSGIAIAESHLDDQRTEVAQKLGKKRVDYVSCAGIDFLIEVETAAVKKVPASWQKISGTKKLSRFHTPEVLRLMQKRDQHKESLAAACEAAFANLLTEISVKYQTFRDCIQSLATLDCLFSLADVAARPGYCKPMFSSSTEISVTNGRHPMVEQMLLSSYVPNSVALSTSANSTRALLITGPNMGGKSSYVRQVALLCIMAQIGSYVPADAATVGLLDAVFTRMGAFDNMLAGESTFMVELSETADILKQATGRSLVILDELGRGTSTHDGVAIAHAVLDHIVREARCLALFITHYQSLAGVAAGFADGALRNVHMRFAETGGGGSGGGNADAGTAGAEADAGDQDITFLYEVGAGVAHRSYGLNVARLAHVPAEVVAVAGVESRKLERTVKAAKAQGMARAMRGLMRGADGDGDGDVGVDVEALAAAVDEL